VCNGSMNGSMDAMVNSLHDTEIFLGVEVLDIKPMHAKNLVPRKFPPLFFSH
jgi:hypothetical protein